MINFGMQRYFAWLIIVFFLFVHVNDAISAEKFSLKLKTPYSQAIFPIELINTLDKLINGNDKVQQVFGKAILVLPQKDPSCSVIPPTSRMYMMYCTGYPWLRTNPPSKYSSGNEIGSLILIGEKKNGKVNILFEVSEDNMELFVFYVGIRKENEKPRARPTVLLVR